MYLGEIIKKYRAEHNLTMEKFAEISGLSKGYISMLEKNQNPQNSRKLAPSIETFKKVAFVMNLEAEDLIKMTDGGQPIVLGRQFEPDLSNIPNLMFPSAKAIPILGEICAGDGIYCEENFEGFFHIDTSIKADCCLKIRGDSMIDAGINDGDIAFIQKSYDYENGKIYAVVINSDCEAVLKRAHWSDETVVLSPCNIAYEPIVADVNDVTVVGECIGVYHSTQNNI